MAAKVIPVWIVMAVSGGMTLLSVGVSYLLRPKAKLGENKPNEYAANIVDTDAFVPIAFGHCVLPTLVAFMDTDPNNINALHGVGATCMGEINEFQAIYFDNMEVVAKLEDGTWEISDNYKDLVKFTRRKGTPADATSARRYEQLTKLFPKWTSKHLSAGIASFSMRFTFHQDKFNILPAVYPRGKWQIVLDVRDNTYKYSNNSALCVLHYMLDKIHGKGLDLDTEIIKDSFIAEANYCDEAIEYTKVDPPERISTIFLLPKEEDNPFTSGDTYYFKYSWGRGTIIETEDDSYTPEESPLSVVASAVAASDYGKFKLTSIDAPAADDNVSLKTVYMATEYGGPYYEVSDMDPEDTNMNVHSTKVGNAHSESGFVNAPGSACVVSFENWSGSALGADKHYRWKTTFKTADGETAPSPATKAIKTKTGQKAVKIKLPETDDSYVTHVCLYRTLGYTNAGEKKINSDYYKEAEIAIGTKYYISLAADGSLGANPPSSTTTLHSYLKRFTCNGLLDTGNDQDDNLDKLLSSCRGRLYNEGGKYRLFIPKITVPETFELTEDNIVGDWEFTIKGMTTKPNVAKASYINPMAEWKSDTVIWPRKDADNFYLKDDNGFKKVLDLDLPFTTHRKIAKTICQVRRKEARNNIIAEVTAMPGARILRGGSLVKVTHPTPIWTEKKFWVDGVGTFPNGQMRLVLIEYTEDDYNYETLGEDTLPGTDTDLGDPTDVPDEVSGVTIAEEKYFRKDTSHWRLKITYTNPVSAFWSHSEIWVRIGEGTNDLYQYITKIDKSSNGVFYIEQLKEFVKYHIKILSVSTLNAKTPLNEATEYTHTTSNVTNPPDVEIFNAVIKDDVVTLLWEHIKEADGSVVKDFNFYEIREGATWAGSTLIGKTKATNYIIKGVTTGTHTYRIKAIDAAGNYSVNDISAQAVGTDSSSWVDRITGNFTTGSHDGTERFDSGGGVYALRVKQNMIPNGSFETDLSGWSNTYNWTRATAGYLGTYCAASPTTALGYIAITGVDFTMEANANTQYIFAAWVWCNTPNSARLLIMLDSGGTIRYSPYHPGNGTWQLLTVRETIGSMVHGSKYVRLTKDTAAGVAYFDDVRYGRTACTYTSLKYDRGAVKTQKGLLSATGYTSGAPVGTMTVSVGISNDDSTYIWYPGLDFSEVTTTGRYVKYRVYFSSSFPSQILYMKEPVAYKETDPYITADKLGSGTADNTKYLRGDNSWQSISGMTGGWTEDLGNNKIYATTDTRKIGIGISTPLAILHIKQLVADLTDGLVLSETAGWGYNPTFIASATNLGKDRLSLKCIDDQFSPLLACRTSMDGNGSLLTSIWPYSDTTGMPWLLFRAVAGMANQPFLCVGDSNFVPPPAAGPPLRNVSGGSMGARNYYVKITHKTATGETTVSAPAAGGSPYAVSANNLLAVDIPPAPDNAITHVRVYVGTSASNHTLQATVAVTNNAWALWTEPTSGLVSGSTPPATNTTGDVQTRINLAQNAANILLQAYAGQSTSLLQFNDSSGTELSGVNPDGGFYCGKIGIGTPIFAASYPLDVLGTSHLKGDIFLDTGKLKNFSGGAAYVIDIIGDSKVTGFSYANYHDTLGNIIRIRGSWTPASASAAGYVGEISWDSSYIYVCIATNTWKRSAITTW